MGQQAQPPQDGEQDANQDRTQDAPPADQGKQYKAARIIPEGANEPLPPVPSTVDITDADIERAIAKWDRILPDYRGLLDAESKDNGEAL